MFEQMVGDAADPVSQATFLGEKTKQRETINLRQTSTESDQAHFGFALGVAAKPRFDRRSRLLGFQFAFGEPRTA